ncbi:type III pantothenate kinase [Marinobacterium aestuariivivens]|uniref:Type III pantothenate kinase n=1 Tax=Marinobacterium aestuariivivens TaxID=1698799 RepID=A0ABW2A0B7_9GAMM
MILDIDVGNTFLKWRCSEPGGIAVRGRLLTERLNDGMPAGWPENVDRVRVASVAGPVVAALISDYCRKRWGLEPEFARAGRQASGVTNSYSEPHRMGVDRWLAMLAAYNLGQGGCCVVDCGSAITIDFVAADGHHLGVHRAGVAADGEKPAGQYRRGGRRSPAGTVRSGARQRYLQCGVSWHQLRVRRHPAATAGAAGSRPSLLPVADHRRRWRAVPASGRSR